MARRSTPFAAIATALVTGDGTPRAREQIIAAVTSALESAFAEGQATGARNARAVVIREAMAIAEGERQAAAARFNTLAQTLGEAEK